MAKTVLQIINRAMHKAKVKALGVTLSDALIENCIEELNDIMFTQAADGLHMGYTEVSTREDLVTVPFYANGFVSSLLAFYICTEAGVNPPATLVAQLENDKRAVEKNLVQNPKRYFNENLPTGASDAGIYEYGAFFGDQLDGAITTESGDFIRNEEGNILGQTEIQEENGDNPFC